MNLYLRPSVFFGLSLRLEFASSSVGTGNSFYNFFAPSWLKLCGVITMNRMTSSVLDYMIYIYFVINLSLISWELISNIPFHLFAINVTLKSTKCILIR